MTSTSTSSPTISAPFHQSPPMPPDTSAPDTLLRQNPNTSACSPNPTTNSNSDPHTKSQPQTSLSLPPACSTSHLSLPSRSYSEPGHHGRSSFFNSLNPRKLFSTIKVSMQPLAPFSPTGSRKISKDISNNSYVEMLTFSPTNPPSELSLSKDKSDNAFTTPRNLRKRNNICYSEL